MGKASEAKGGRDILSSACQLGRESPEEMKANKAIYASIGWPFPQASQGPKLGREVRYCSKGETQPEIKGPQ